MWEIKWFVCVCICYIYVSVSVSVVCFSLFSFLSLSSAFFIVWLFDVFHYFISFYCIEVNGTNLIWFDLLQSFEPSIDWNFDWFWAIISREKKVFFLHLELSEIHVRNQAKTVSQFKSVFCSHDRIKWRFPLHTHCFFSIFYFRSVFNAIANCWMEMKCSNQFVEQRGIISANYNPFLLAWRVRTSYLCVIWKVLW